MTRTTRGLLLGWLVLGTVLWLLCWQRAAEAQHTYQPGCRHYTGQDCPPGSQCGAADAQRWQPARIQRTSAPSAQSHPSVFRVVIHDINGSQSHQTGCLVWKHPSADVAFVATAAHGFTSDSRKILVLSGPGKGGFEAIAKHIDHVWDIAILAIRRPAASVFRFAARRPVVNQVLRLGGFVGGRQWRWHDGQFRGWAGPVGGHPMELLIVPSGVTSGCSGGPILDSSGALVGIVSAGDTGPGYWHIQATITKVLAGDEPETETEENEPTIADDSPPLPEATAYDELRLLIEKNAEAIAALAGCVAVPGPAGEKGEKGERGADGTSPTIDYDHLAAEVEKRLKPIYVRHLDEVTGIETVETVSLGEGFTIFDQTPK